jgi:transposase
LNCSRTTVRKWVDRFRQQPKESSLKDADRSGRPAVIPAFVKCEVVKIACSFVCQTEANPLVRWTLNTLKSALLKTTGYSISKSEIHRILQDGELKPHKVRMWMHSPDPNFRQKVSDIATLYLNPPANAVVLCVDEKSGIQAIERKRRVKNGEIRLDTEYKRHGTQTVIAAFEVKTGQIISHCGKTRKKEDIEKFMEEIAQRYPHQEVYIIWDNLNIHKGDRWWLFNEKYQGRYHFVYTPVHASWINQIEIWFGILQRKVIKHGSFTSEEELRNTIERYIEQWNTQEAHPFRWHYRGYTQAA